MIQGGGESNTTQPAQTLTFPDFTKRNGTGGESIYGHPFEDENFKRDVDAEGYAHPTHTLNLTLTRVGCWSWPTEAQIPTLPNSSLPFVPVRT